MFVADEVMGPAITLSGITGVTIARDLERVSYLHFLYDSHQIVFAEGLHSEAAQTVNPMPAAAPRIDGAGCAIAAA